MRKILAPLAGVLLALCAVSSASATTVPPPQFRNLVRESDYIVRAVVKNITTQLEMREGQEVPFTLVELDVTEVIAGEPPATVVLRLLGGKTTTGRLLVVGSPEFNVGDEDILFVQRNGRVICPLHSWGYGRYLVRRDSESGAEYMARSNGLALLDVAEISTPMSDGAAATLQRRTRDPSDALTPARFIERIKQERADAGADKDAR